MRANLLFYLKNTSVFLKTLSSLFRFVRLVFDENLEPKMINNRAITAPELKTYFEVYVKMFQADSTKFPKVSTVCNTK